MGLTVREIVNTRDEGALIGFRNYFAQYSGNDEIRVYNGKASTPIPNWVLDAKVETWTVSITNADRFYCAKHLILVLDIVPEDKYQNKSFPVGWGIM